MLRFTLLVRAMSDYTRRLFAMLLDSSLILSACLRNWSGGAARALDQPSQSSLQSAQIEQCSAKVPRSGTLGNLGSSFQKPSRSRQSLIVGTTHVHLLVVEQVSLHVRCGRGCDKLASHVIGRKYTEKKRGQER